ncbi:MAG: hypothetical protein GAK31_00993 [Stenotrophomonas maltophilia]|uniref:Uncharacterized protein n=1 Tax=Stenotrophomonas maltophilia TaxID=40324 RepID=A0A7V8FGW3_STEMA|nr:MAG: hypothetical protein GAK31_00993 [Stenotrophomonas maltophilia]
MHVAALALTASLSFLPDIGWQEDRAEDAHQLALCQAYRDQMKTDGKTAELQQQATAYCDLLAREYRRNWDFDRPQEPAIDFNDLPLDPPPTRQ